MVDFHPTGIPDSRAMRSAGPAGLALGAVGDGSLGLKLLPAVLSVIADSAGLGGR
jgi:hypothetical protein